MHRSFFISRIDHNVPIACSIIFDESSIGQCSIDAPLLAQPENQKHTNMTPVFFCYIFNCVFVLISLRINKVFRFQNQSTNPYVLFSIPEDECKKKWKTLRIQQRRIIIAKIKKKEKSSAIQWHYYDSLKFLIPHMDWTATDEQSIKTETDLDLSVLSEIGNDEQDDGCEESYENDERCESISDESSYSSTHQVFATDNTVEATNSPGDSLCAANTQQVLASNETSYQPQYLLTTAVGDQMTHQSVQQQPQTTIFSEPTTITNATVTTVDANKYQMNNRIITVPVTTAPSIVNYFLMDVAVQMERLNDIAQMEMKIEIHRLLLEKLKNINNLRQPQSMCFAAPANHN